jgi:hypothetical protein
MYNMMLLPIYTNRHHCYNKEVMSVGTRLNFYYIHDLFFHFVSFLLIAGSIYSNKKNV